MRIPGLRLRRLVRHRGDDGFDQFPGIDRHRLEFAPALAGEVENRGYQPVHLADRRLDEAERLGEILRELPVVALEDELGSSAATSAGGPARDPPEDVTAQLLELAGEAHDVHQRRAQIVADDIGEALNLVVGLAQVGGAFVDRGLEIEVVVAQPGFGVIARARRSAAPARSNGGQRDDQGGAGDGDDRCQLLGAVGGPRYAARTAGLPRRRMSDATSFMRRTVSLALACRSIATPPARSFCLANSIATFASSASRVRRPAHAADCCFRPEPGCPGSRRSACRHPE